MYRTSKEHDFHAFQGDDQAAVEVGIVCEGD